MGGFSNGFNTHGQLPDAAERMDARSALPVDTSAAQRSMRSQQVIPCSIAHQSTRIPRPDRSDYRADDLASAMFCEFGTISAQGVPIDTPLFCFADPSSRTIDVGTGLAYPAKAERARRNPKVGLLLEGGPSQPVISIGALATVKDADIQANAERYIAEVIAYFEAFSAGNPWSVARQAVWYWARILMLATPKKILWWRSPAHMDEPPQRWDAPADLHIRPPIPRRRPHLRPRPMAETRMARARTGTARAEHDGPSHA